MKDGFIRVAAATPDLRVADVAYNREQIKKQIEEGAKKTKKVKGLSSKKLQKQMKR